VGNLRTYCDLSSGVTSMLLFGDAANLSNWFADVDALLS
jgi:hypothetical protein